MRWNIAPGPAGTGQQLVLELQLDVRVPWFWWGLSETGSMAGSDVLMVSVDSSGAVRLEDCYSTRGLFMSDAQQDWSLESEDSKDGARVIRVLRLVETLDACCDHDVPMGIPAFVVWGRATGNSPSVPSSCAAIGAQEDLHGMSMVPLTDQARQRFVPTAAAEAAKMLSLRVHKSIPPKETTVWCRR